VNPLEQTCRRLRHSPLLKRADWLWNAARPVYDAVVNAAGRGGLERVINGTDRVLIAPQFRNLGEGYEPEVWRLVMAALRPGDHVADVGAHIGLYAVALARRVGPAGRVTAFEPDARNYQLVLRHARLNGVGAQMRVVNAAVSGQDGTISFSGDKDIQNQIVPAGTPGARQVPVVRLDTHFAGGRVDLLKVDVEGFEEEVLAGAEGLLNDPKRAPRNIFIEVHPYNWHLCGTTSESLLGRLRRLGYTVEHLDGKPVERIAAYGEVVARRKDAGLVAVRSSI
jgi:FkbM family methyltransferase